MKLTFRVKLLLGWLAITAVAELLTVAALDRSVSAELTSQLSRRLEDQARGSGAWVAVGRHPDEIASRLSNIVAARVTLFDAGGEVIGDSTRGDVDDLDAPEVAAARRGGVGRETRFSSTLGEDVHYVAVPVQNGLVIRLAAPLTGVKSTLSLMRFRLLLASAFVFALAAALSLLAARLLARPLVAMRDAAHDIAGGAYDVELGPFPKDEFGDLAQSLKSLATQLDTRIGEIVRMEEMRRQFLDDITHEISTPVAAIQGYAETLQAGKADPATTKEFLDVIHRHAGRIGRLVEDLRFISSLDARVPEERLVEPVPLAEVARYVNDTVRKRAEAKQATIDIDVAPDVLVLGDPDHVERILLNLVDNAVKYGRDSGTVKVRAARSGDRVVVEVSDDGPGIAGEHLPRIFDRFYRVDRGRSRDKGGTGLGLAIVKQLAVAMHGSASVDSESGKGTRFRIELPVASA